MKSKELLQIRNKFKKYLNDKKILDIVLFGSFVKGKAFPNDIDVAVISDKELDLFLKGFHFSYLSPKDFFKNPPSIIHTLFREGYSLKYKRFFSEAYKFSSKVLFYYELSGLSPSEKVRVVNALRGKGNDKGLVKENKAEWIANQVFLCAVGKEHTFEKLFLNLKVKFKKFYVLMH